MHESSSDVLVVGTGTVAGARMFPDDTRSRMTAEVTMVALTLKTLEGSSLPVPGADPWYADPSDPALTVMTDFRLRGLLSAARVRRLLSR